MVNVLAPFRAIGRWSARLHFNWHRRRYSYRASLYYNCVAIAMCVGLVMTILLHHFIQTFNFFANYECDKKGIKFISGDVLGMTILALLYVFTCVFMARLTAMFSNYSLSDFMTTGKWADRLGCLVKWTPWLMALFLISMLTLEAINIISIYTNPRLWCESRWKRGAIRAVRNCRLFYRDECKVDGAVKNAALMDCNDGHVLTRDRWLAFSDVYDPDTGNLKFTNSCDLKVNTVCKAYVDYVKGSAIQWNQPDLAPCAGESWSEVDGIHYLAWGPELKGAYLEPLQESDLYKYCKLYTILWASGFASIVIFAAMIRSITSFDAFFYQPPQSSDGFFRKLIRPFTPWVY